MTHKFYGTQPSPLGYFRAMEGTRPLPFTRCNIPMFTLTPDAMEETKSVASGILKTPASPIHLLYSRPDLASAGLDQLK